MVQDMLGTCGVSIVQHHAIPETTLRSGLLYLTTADMGYSFCRLCTMMIELVLYLGQFEEEAGTMMI